MEDDEAALLDAGLSLSLAHGAAARRRSPLPAAPSVEPSLSLALPGAGGRASSALKKAGTVVGVYSGGGECSSPPGSIQSSSSSSSFRMGQREDDEGRVEKVSSSRVSPEESEEVDGGGGCGTARKKLRLTKEQSALLEDSFREHATLNPKQKQGLAKQLKLRPRQVEVWFQNRRARTKLKKTELELEILRKCCQTLTEENSRLQKELHQLSAAAGPRYLRQLLPAAPQLRVCPSCKKAVGGDGAGDAAEAQAPGKSHLFNPFAHSAAC